MVRKVYTSSSCNIIQTLKHSEEEKTISSVFLLKNKLTFLSRPPQTFPHVLEARFVFCLRPNQRLLEDGPALIGLEHQYEPLTLHPREALGRGFPRQAALPKGWI